MKPKRAHPYLTSNRVSSIARNTSQVTKTTTMGKKREIVCPLESPESPCKVPGDRVLPIYAYSRVAAFRPGFYILKGKGFGGGGRPW